MFDYLLWISIGIGICIICTMTGMKIGERRKRYFLTAKKDDAEILVKSGEVNIVLTGDPIKVGELFIDITKNSAEFKKEFGTFFRQNPGRDFIEQLEDLIAEENRKNDHWADVIEEK